MTEQWALIKEDDYQGLRLRWDYEISTKGRLRRPSKNGNKYLYINGCPFKSHKSKAIYRRYHLNGRDDIFRVFAHVLVAKAFIPNPDGFTQVNHKDGKTTDLDGCLINDISNLEWNTQSINIQHAFATGLNRPLYGFNNGSYKFSEQDKIDIKELKYTEAIRRFGISKTHYYRIKKS